jgi:hypothetical protein
MTYSLLPPPSSMVVWPRLGTERKLGLSEGLMEIRGAGSQPSLRPSPMTAGHSTSSPINFDPDTSTSGRPVGHP